MVFNWWKRRSRKRLLRRPVPKDWESIAANAIPWFDAWDNGTRGKFLNDLRIFVAEKAWEGCDGLEVNDDMKVVVGAQAAMMLAGVEDYYFDGVRTILLYPRPFWRKTRHGLIVGDDVLSGEAWHRGPIVLSWSDVIEDWEGHNVVVHELAHHLDGLDGDISGVPILGNRVAQERWEEIAARTFRQLNDDLAAGRETFLDPYAATHRAELLAVACESFFELPVELKDHHDDLFACLVDLFQIDPSRWADR